MNSNNAMTLQGATPQGFSSSFYSLPGKTPQSQALNNAGTATGVKTGGQVSTAPIDWNATNLKPTMDITPKPLPQMDISSQGAIKKQTVTEYHPPAVTTPPVSNTGLIDSPAAPQLNTPQPQPITYPGLIGTLASTSLAGSNNSNQAQSGLLGSQTANDALNAEAQAVKDRYGQQINSIGQIGANQAAGEASTGSTAVGGGNARLTQAVTADKQQAAATAGNFELSALDRQLTAQGQAQSGLNAAGGLANTAQGQIQSGLSNATGAAAPILSAYGQANYGIGGTGGELTPGSAIDTALNQYAQQAATGQISAIPSSITSNPVLNAELNRRAQAINPSYNPIASAAQGQATASNIQTAGTTQTQNNADLYSQYNSQYVNTSNALNQVESLGSLALQTAQGGSINPFTVKAANQTLSALKSQLTSPSQATFDQSMAAFQGALSQLLSNSSNVTPTQISTWSGQIADGSMPVETLQAIYNQGLTEGKLKTQNLQSTRDYLLGQMQQGGTNNNSTASSGGSGGAYSW